MVAGIKRNFFRVNRGKRDILLRLFYQKSQYSNPQNSVHLNPRQFFVSFGIYFWGKGILAFFASYLVMIDIE